MDTGVRVYNLVVPSRMVFPYVSLSYWSCNLSTECQRSFSLIRNISSTVPREWPRSPSSFPIVKAVLDVRLVEGFEEGFQIVARRFESALEISGGWRDHRERDGGVL